MAKWRSAALGAAVGMFLPIITQAQGLSNQVNSLQGVLNQLYEEMIPLCSQFIGVGQGIAGFAATWYIALRVWRHLANAEPIDFYPLFRPFVIGFAVLIFPSVLALINGVMQPTVTATAKMVQGSDKAITVLLKQKEAAIKKTNAWQVYVGEAVTGTNGTSIPIRITRQKIKKGFWRAWAMTLNLPCRKPLMIFVIQLKPGSAKYCR